MPRLQNTRPFAISILLGLSGALAAAADSPPATRCSKIIREQFPKWDLDSDKKLVAAEIDQAVLNHAVKGDAAAALSVVKDLEIIHTNDGKKEAPPFTLDAIEKYEHSRAAKKKVQHDLDDWFDQYKAKIDRTSRELFAKGKPHLEGVRQGDLGDCYFMAVMGKVVYRDPDSVMKMITPGEKKNYTVQFAGVHQKVLVPNPTDAEIAFNSTAGEDGLWMTVLELAYAKVENRRHKKSDRLKLPTDNIAYGGSSRATITLLSGHGVIDLDSDEPQKLHQGLTAGHKAKSLMSMGIRAKIKAPPGVHSGHVYAVLDYDSAKKILTCFDPYGSDFNPDGAAGLEFGFPRKGGVFMVHLADFVKISSGVLVENAAEKAHFKSAVD